MHVPTCDTKLKTVGAFHKWDKRAAFQWRRCRMNPAEEHFNILAQGKFGGFAQREELAISRGLVLCYSHRVFYPPPPHHTFHKLKCLHDFRISMGLFQEWRNQLFIRIGIIPIAPSGNDVFLFLMKGLVYLPKACQYKSPTSDCLWGFYINFQFDQQLCRKISAFLAEIKSYTAVYNESFTHI